MREISIFNSEEFGDIRAIEIDNEPWFVGKDIATALGYSNTRKAIGDHVHEDDKTFQVDERQRISYDTEWFL